MRLSRLHQMFQQCQRNASLQGSFVQRQLEGFMTTNGFAFTGKCESKG